MIAPMLILDIILISIYVTNWRIFIFPSGVLRLLYCKICITLLMFMDRIVFCDKSCMYSFFILETHKQGHCR
jgi:hypothetical protein